jgi:hypothetical protein
MFPVYLTFQAWESQLTQRYHRVVIVATGSDAPPLKCSSAPGITGAADDIITTCTGSTELNGKLVDQNVLPEFSLVTAPATTGGCTVNSVVDPTWTFGQTSWQTDYAKSTTAESLYEFGTQFTTPGFQYWFYGFIGQDNLPGAANPSTWSVLIFTRSLSNCGANRAFYLGMIASGPFPVTGCHGRASSSSITTRASWA